CRCVGVADGGVEVQGSFCVMVELRVRYRRPAFYDEQLLLETTCSNVTPGKVEHTYKLTRPGTGVVLAEGYSVLACVDGQSKLRRIPRFMYAEPEQPEEAGDPTV
ncbi:MAG: acyl-CoA thioesterase, partial [Planctomycetaceae bacterium]